jgi:predicted metal-binding membrane protein
MLGVAALAWAGVIAYVRDMGNGAGTMGLSLGEFMTMWSLMMVAMMLPAVAPVATLYARTITTDRAARLALFVAGYLVAWALTGLPIFGVLRVVDHLVSNSDAAMRNVAATALIVAGVYQLTPLKDRCLRHCRSPLGQLLRYAQVKGPLRDFRVALHHAGYCVGCCWALMVLFVAFGVMSVWAMVVLAALVFAEKVARRGELITRLSGMAFVVLAALVLVSPRVADAVVPDTGSMPDGSMQMQV